MWDFLHFWVALATALPMLLAALIAINLVGASSGSQKRWCGFATQTTLGFNARLAPCSVCGQRISHRQLLVMDGVIGFAGGVGVVNPCQMRSRTPPWWQRPSEVRAGAVVGCALASTSECGPVLQAATGRADARSRRRRSASQATPS